MAYTTHIVIVTTKEDNFTDLNKAERLTFSHPFMKRNSIKKNAIKYHENLLNILEFITKTDDLK